MGTQAPEFVADVLIAVEEPVIRGVISTALRSHEGVRTLNAMSADDLIGRLSRERYDALVVAESFGGLIYQGLVSLIRSGDLCRPNLPVVLVFEHGGNAIVDVANRYFVRAVSTPDIPQIASAVRAAIEERPRPTALLIDDNEHFLALLAEQLQGTFRVVMTSAPEEVDDLFDDIGPDIVVCDYSMPFRDGEGVARGLRARREDTPIVILTAHDTPANHVTLAKAGITRFISKKMPLPEIERVLRDLVFEQAMTRVSQSAVDEANALNRLVRAIEGARTDLKSGRAGHADERLKGALMRRHAIPTDDDPGIEKELS